jgi:hypothetical protein
MVISNYEYGLKINKYTENKLNKTTIMILQAVMQIRTNCGRNEDAK